MATAMTTSESNNEPMPFEFIHREGKVETCERCGSHDFEYESVDGESDSTWQQGSCNICGWTWFDVYSYSHYEVPREQPKDCREEQA